MTERGRRPIALLMAGGVLASLLVVVAMAGDLGEVRHLLTTLRWQALAWLPLLAIADHGLRYWRWERLLKQVASASFSRATGLLLFLAGSLLIFTPGRVGEAVKSLYVRDRFGIPMASSLPVLAAERLVDIGVMATLAGLGLLLLGETGDLWMAGLVLGGALLLIVVVVPLLMRLARRYGGTGGRASRVWETLRLVDESRRLLLAPPALATNVALGTTAWLVEVLIYLASLVAVGAALDADLLILALAVFPLASLGGSLSFLPGGIGVTEGGLAALGVLLGGLTGEEALMAALLSRAAILGVLVLGGLAATGLLRRDGRTATASDTSKSDALGREE